MFSGTLIRSIINKRSAEGSILKVRQKSASIGLMGLVDFPTFSIQNPPTVGKFTIDGMGKDIVYSMKFIIRK